MKSVFGDKITVSLFGESHGTHIGGVLSGFPPGIRVDESKLHKFLMRRNPGNGRNKGATNRIESDRPKFLSGIKDGYTNGFPIAFTIENQDIKEDDYFKIKDVPRPGHSDYTAKIKYRAYADISGGGHFSGRLTAPLCVCGWFCIALLRMRGIEVSAEIASIHGKSKDMEVEIEKAEATGDSVGGVISCIIKGVHAGYGGPYFEGLEGEISKAIFAIPAVKGIEFGNGFESTKIYGSENNDEYTLDEDLYPTGESESDSCKTQLLREEAFCDCGELSENVESMMSKRGSYVTMETIGQEDIKKGDILQEIKMMSNNSGGILGGISTGSDITFNVAIKPTPSIKKAQRSIDLKTGKPVNIEIKGRHDSCIVPRAVPCVEAAAAIALVQFVE